MILCAVELLEPRTLFAGTVTAGGAYQATAGSAVFINGGGSVKRFDFGDPQAAHNTFKGYNAAHVYSAPGVYSASETDTAGNAVTHVVTVASASAPVKVVGFLDADLKAAVAGSTLLLQRGKIYDCWATNYVKQSIFIDATGTGDAPVIRMRNAGTYAFFVMGGAQPSISNVVIDSNEPLASYPGKVARHGFYLKDGGATIRNVVFKNLDNGIQGSQWTRNVYVADCVFEDTIRSCGIYGGGSGWTITGDSFGQSRYEHDLRFSIGQYEPIPSYVLIDACSFANRYGTKENVTLRDVRYASIQNSNFHYKWLQIGQGTPNSWDSAKDVLVENNVFDNGAYIQVNPLASATINSNLFIDSGNLHNPIYATGGCAMKAANNTWQVKSATTKTLIYRFSYNGLMPSVSESGDRVVVK